MAPNQHNEDWGDLAPATSVAADKTNALPGIFGAYQPRSAGLRQSSIPSVGLSIQRRIVPGDLIKDTDKESHSISASSSRVSIVSDAESIQAKTTRTKAPSTTSRMTRRESCPANLVSSRASSGMKRPSLKLRSPCPSQSCMESYRLFQKCNTGSADPSTRNCGVVVASYMKCALNQC